MTHRRLSLGRFGSSLAAAILLVLPMAQPASALDPTKSIDDYVIRSWDEEQRLPHRLVYALLQSQDGYLWLGTQDGLVRFDGVRFTVFNNVNEPAITENGMRAIAQTPDGALHIAPLRADLLRLSSSRFEVLRNLLPPEWLRSSVSDLRVDSGGTLWVTGAGGIGRLEGGKLQTLSTGSAASDLTFIRRRICEGEGGRIWYTSPEGLHVIDMGRLATILTKENGRGLYADRRGTVWAGFDGAGLIRLSGGTVTPVPLSDRQLRVNAILGDRDGNLWVGTDVGLFRLRRSLITPDAVSEAFKDIEVEDLIEDTLGNLWVATRSGLYVVRDPIFQTFSATTGVHEVVSVVEDGLEVLWFVTRQPPFVQQLREGRVSAYSGPPLPEGVNVIFRDRNGTLWLGANAGLFRLSGEQWARVPDAPQAAITTIAQDPAGQLWFADAKGTLHRRRDGSWESFAENAGLPGRRIESMYGAPDGSLWLATQGGIFRLLRGRISEVKLGEGEPYRYARFVGADEEGFIWIGTRVGLTRYNGKDDTFRTFTPKEGLPDPIVNMILDDRRGNLWVGCSKGIYRVAKSEFANLFAGKSKSVHCVLFGRRNGIAAGQAWGSAALRSRDGSLWFGTTRGIVGVPRARLDEIPPPPTVHIEDTRVDSRPLRADGTAPPGSGLLAFRFTGLSFDAPDLVRFIFKLEGFDPDWREAEGQREVTYTRVEPGEYTFRVKAANSAGKWSPEGAALKLRLLPHFYQTRLFFVVGALLALGAAYGIYRFRLHQLGARERELARKVEARTHELQEERDLHHALMENVPDLIYYKDASSRYTRVNPAHAKTLGLASPAAAVGKTDFDFFSPEFAQSSLADEQALLKTGQALVGKAEYDQRTARWYLATKVPILNAAGEPSGLVGISKDITERKGAEEQLDQNLATFLGLVRQVADGDMTRRSAPGDDTLGRIGSSVNLMLDNFEGILTELRGVALSVSTASTEILAAATEIAKGAQYGSDEVHATSTAVDEMAGSMLQVSRNAEASAAAARRVVDHLRESSTAVNAASQGMERIDSAVSVTAEKMRILGERGEEIFAIIDLIQDIAARSELLSLNAAIEAAHAGDAGRGFGGIADEIRRLAEQSTEATKNVTSVVQGMVKETRSVLDAMETSMKEVKEGLALSERMRAGLQEISTLVGRTTDLTTEISNAAREQTSATQIVARSMQTIANITQESAAGAAETSRAVRDLVSLAESLNRLLARFKITANVA
jgi:PAS domain S-box-containing protein